MQETIGRIEANTLIKKNVENYWSNLNKLVREKQIILKERGEEITRGAGVN